MSTIVEIPYERFEGEEEINSETRTNRKDWETLILTIAAAFYIILLIVLLICHE